MSTTSYPQIFLCSVNDDDDKQKVNEVYERLRKFGLRPWMASHDLMPGQSKNEILNALRKSAIILIFFSNASVNRQGFAQREIRDAIELLDEMPSEKIFSIPVRLDTCDIPNERLRDITYYDLFQEDGFEKLIGAIKKGMVSSGNVQPLIIKTRDERTTYLTNELKMFYDSHKKTLSKQVIRYSGSLSTFAVEEKNPDLQRDNPELLKSILRTVLQN